MLLVVDGPRWATVVKNGRPRIEDPKDFVRLEVEPALYNSEVTVIPLLVGRASMPEPDELPAQLRPLARRQAHELTNERWDYDIELLNRWLEERCGLEPVAPAPTSTAARPLHSHAHSESHACSQSHARTRGGLTGRAHPDRRPHCIRRGVAGQLAGERADALAGGAGDESREHRGRGGQARGNLGARGGSVGGLGWRSRNAVGAMPLEGRSPACWLARWLVHSVG